MTLTSRRSATFAVAAASAIALAAPALATTQLPSTSLNLRASKSVVKAHHAVGFTATLSSDGKGVSGQTLDIQQRIVKSNGTKTSWQDVTPQPTITDNGNGTYTFSLNPPIAVHKNTQKDQYRAVFAKTTQYKGSHSQVITVTVKRTTS